MQNDTNFVGRVGMEIKSPRWVGMGVISVPEQASIT